MKWIIIFLHYSNIFKIDLPHANCASSMIGNSYPGTFPPLAKVDGDLKFLVIIESANSPLYKKKIIRMSMRMPRHFDLDDDFEFLPLMKVDELKVK
jgi:hypothetical protein